VGSCDGTWSSHQFWFYKSDTSTTNVVGSIVPTIGKKPRSTLATTAAIEGFNNQAPPV
jgi:hypothetical protein